MKQLKALVASLLIITVFYVVPLLAATHRISILGAATIPDASGNVYFEPASVNFQVNDMYPNMVAVFANTGTRDTLGCGFQVPQNYVGTAVIGLIWATTLTTGDVRWEFDYDAIAAGETGDPDTTAQESVGSTVTTNGTARIITMTEISLTSGNFAAADWVQCKVARDGADAADTAAGSAYLLGAYFEYAD